MGPTSRRVLVLAAAVAFLAPREASAMGAVVGPSEHPVAIGSARVAVASSPGRTTRWAQITVTNDESSFAWLLPVLPGARVDLASDAWLDALDSATVPVVMPPVSPSDCDAILTPQVLAPEATPTSRLPAQALVALDASSLASFVVGSGLAIPAALTTSLADVFSSGSAVLALVYGASHLPVHTVRIVDGGPATLPFALTGSVGGVVPVTAFTVASSAEQAGSSPLTIAPGTIVWFADGTSSYESAATSLVAAADGQGWLTQSSQASSFFLQTPIQVGHSLPAALGAYYVLASTYGDTSVDPATCTVAAEATEESSSTYEAACPSGALAVVPGASPCGESSPEATPITGMVCGAAGDAALAVADLSPASVWVTRIEGIVTAASANDVPLLPAGTTPEAIVLTAGSFGSHCASPDAGAWAEGDGGGLGDDGGAGGGWGEGGGPFGDDEGGVLSSLGDAPDATSDGCGSSSSSGDDSSDGDACSGDSSSDDSGGCSGDDSSVDSGGCSGDNDCSTAKHRHRNRSPVSRVVIVAALALGLARRLRRVSPSPTRVR
jgi:hypothetical protein